MTKTCEPTKSLCRIVGIILALVLLAGVSDPTSARNTPPLPPSPPSAYPLSHPLPGIIEPALARALAYAGPQDTFHVIVYLQEQANPQAAIVGAPNVTEARSRLVETLQTTAARSQAPLRVYLAGAQAAGLVESYTPFWIVNGIAVHANRDTVSALAARPEIVAIRLDYYRQWLPAIPTRSDDFSRYYRQERKSLLQTQVEWGIERIRADDVWHTLYISGTGTVVAGMDTGVDWLHPALQANYRGYNPHGPSNHIYSWYDATDGGALYPVDGHGHGSHTLGTIAGQEGIGVAPGARWIGVKVLNNQGYGYDSWIHAGFQWLLAPGGDPAKAPDVVNCSWGNSNGHLTTFQPDLQALRAAGILAVFANGNNGPNAGTVGSPASLPEAFAVGASDDDDEVANFSSRGPSPWGEMRPHVVAPGVSVYSALPGGVYGEMDGTSMAAPHVSGVVALVRSVSPTLSITRTAYVITSTAIPLTVPLPNNDSGWGRVDAFAAVAAVAHPGFITGTVTCAGDGASVAGATVAAAPHGGGGGGTATTGDDGIYLLALAPTVYDVTASAFGYEPATTWGVAVTTDTMTVVDFSLTAYPTGTLRGLITDATTGDPVIATVTVLDTPIETSASQYTFALPSGDYTIRASSLGYRVVTRTVHVVAGITSTADLALEPAPTILLLDSGRWHYESEVEYFCQTLDELAYAYDEWAIKHLPDDLPTAADLLPYKVVVWSAPEDAPGFIGAQDAIVGYLDGGGRLLLTGQDVGYWDGGGALGYWSAYYRDYLKTRYVSDNAPTRVLEGLEGDIFAGLTLTITGAGGADNQDYPDEIAVTDPDAAAPVLIYQGGGCGGVRVGTCLDYRVVYLSFGFEAINDADTRQEVMRRTLDWLTFPLPTVGLELTPASQQQIGPPGALVTHTLRVRHVGQAGGADTVSLSLDGASWATQLGAPSLTLAPCASAVVLISVTVPATATWDTRDVVTLTARSSLSPTLALSATITTKAPAPVLLVDDDRWYNQEAKYKVALAAGDFPYDYWSTTPDGGPPLNILQHYPVVVWFTGYDWYAPLTGEEEEILADYLDGGGRLFFSSQDYLYYNFGSDFSRDYLGVLTYTEDVTPTLAVGVPENLIADQLGPCALTYPFTNWSDAVEPTPGTAVSFRDQNRHPIALARREEVGAWLPRPTRLLRPATVFFSFPFETLPETGRAEVMERTVGWLSWLGDSTFAAGRGAASGGDTLTYTIALRNDGPATVTGSLSNTLPFSLTLVPGSLTGTAAYYTSTRRVSWEGALGAGVAVTITYRVTVATGSTVIVNIACLGLENQHIYFHRAAVVRVDAPDLSPSAFSCGPSPARPGTVVTCTLALANVGTDDALTATATISLPANAALVPGSLAWASGGAAEALPGTVRWSGPLSVGGQVSLTYRLTLPTNPVHPPLYSVAFLEDEMGGAWERAAWLLLEPLRFYLPVVMRDG